MRYQLFVSKSKVCQGKQLVLVGARHKNDVGVLTLRFPARAVNLNPLTTLSDPLQSLLSSAVADECR